ncbi:MAG: class I SAM-dependent methyltransferase [Proteobacteria bacterium]|nr:class I SAM-dependent methyltransferase [Pseudomonadota bacterium]
MGRKNICPVERAGGFDAWYRKWFQNPDKILGPLVKEGMAVIDYGCGPGFFTVSMANLVGESGKVVAIDIQEGMLELLNKKIRNSDIKKRIVLHKCDDENIAITEPIDFILAFYVIHEVPHKNILFEKFNSILKPHGKILIVEPPIHVSRAGFNKSLKIAQNNGFTLEKGPGMLFSKTALLTKNKHH